MIALPWVGVSVLLVVLWTIAAALAIALIMDKLSSILNGVPWIGGKLSDAVKSMSQAITNACGTLMAGAESLVGAGLHLIARYLDRWLSEFVAHAGVIAHLARIVGDAIYSVSGLRALVHGLERAFHGIEQGVRDLTREFHGIEAQVRKIERELAQGIGNDLRTRFDALYKEWESFKTGELRALEGDVAAIPGDIANAEDWVSKNFVTLSKAGLVAAVTAALGFMGLGGLSCNNFKNLLSKYACGLGSLLDGLLGLMIAGIALEAVCDFLPLIEEAFGAVVGPITHMLTEVPLGSCEQEPASWSQLHVAAGPLPPAQSLGSFPS